MIISVIFLEQILSALNAAHEPRTQGFFNYFRFPATLFIITVACHNDVPLKLRRRRRRYVLIRWCPSLVIACLIANDLLIVILFTMQSFLPFLARRARLHSPTKGDSTIIIHCPRSRYSYAPTCPIISISLAILVATIVSVLMVVVRSPSVGG